MIQLPDIPEIPEIHNQSNIAIYAWIISILMLVIVSIIIYFKTEAKQFKDELKTERDYIKEESIKNMLTLQRLTTVMESLVIDTSKSLDNTNEMKPLMQNNAQRIETIKDHIIRTNRDG